MSTKQPVSFVFGDRQTRPPKGNRTVEHILGDLFTTQGFIGMGIALQAAFAYLTPAPYTLLPGALFIAGISVPTVLGLLGLRTPTEEESIVVGKTAAFLDFANPAHAGKQPGSPALADPDSLARPRPPRLALMLIGSQCHSRLGALQPEFKQMGEVFSGMISELRSAPPEEDTGFLNAEFYMHGGRSSCNGNMVTIYFKSYAHMARFAHREGGAHWPAWNKFRTLQREKPKLGTEIGIWHEVYEIANAEAIYHNMPRIGLGDMWDAVRAPNGQHVYRNGLVMANGSFATSDGRLGYCPSWSEKEKAESGGGAAHGACPHAPPPSSY